LIDQQHFPSPETRKLCEKKQSYGIICTKQHAKHNMEKVCEKKKQHRSATMPLLRLLEEILSKSYLREKRKVF
jgi:hypothetical protein